METGPRLIQEGSKPSCLRGPRPPTQEAPQRRMLRTKTRQAPGKLAGVPGPLSRLVQGSGASPQTRGLGTRQEPGI